MKYLDVSGLLILWDKIKDRDVSNADFLEFVSEVNETLQLISLSILTYDNIWNVSEVNNLLYGATTEETTSPEFTFVILDNEDKVLYGVRVDNTIFVADTEITHRLGLLPLIVSMFPYTIGSISTT